MKYIYNLFKIKNNKSLIRKSYFISFLLAFLWFGLESIFVPLLHNFFQTIGILKIDDQAIFNNFTDNALIAIVILVLYGLVRTLVQFFKNYNIEKDKQIYIQSLRNNLYRRILNISIDKIENDSHFLNTLINESTRSGELIRQIHSLIYSTITSLFLGLIAFYYAQYEMLIGITSTIIMLPVVNHYNKFAKRFGDSSVKINNDLMLHLSNTLASIKNIQAYNKIDSFTSVTNNILTEQKTVTTRFERLKIFKQVIPTFLGVIWIAIIGYTSHKYFDTKSSELLSFFYVFLRMIQSLSYSMTSLSNIHYLLPAHENVEKSLSVLCLNSKKDIEKNLKLEDNILEIKDFDIRQNNKKEIIKLNLKIKEGSLILIKGKSGSGKSTLLMKLMGLIQNSSSIQYNKKLTAENLAYVDSNPLVLDKSIFDNLEYLNGKISEFDFQKAINAASIDFVGKDSSFKIDSRKLSTGQRSRIGIARSLCRNSTLLIMDEATSNLDINLEKKILHNIKINYRNLTIIIATHRDSLDEFSDEIITIGYNNE